MRSGVTHYPMSCHGCFVGCGEMTPSRLQPMTRQTLHISRLWRGMILARFGPYLWAAPATKIIRMALYQAEPRPDVSSLVCCTPLAQARTIEFVSDTQKLRELPAVHEVLEQLAPSLARFPRGLVVFEVRAGRRA